MTTPVLEGEDICANCGVVDGDGAVKLKKCNACRLVKYCGIECQKAHRPVHKRACKKRAAQLYEEKLFAKPEREAVCPLCFLPMPFEKEKISYSSCCGKEICHGCSFTEMSMRVDGAFPPWNAPHDTSSAPFADVDFKKMLEQPCPFCRTPFAIKAEDHYEQLCKRVDKGDSKAMYHLGIKLTGKIGSIPADSKRARELLLRSSKMGYPLANLSVGMFYYDGKYPAVFPKDLKKAEQYFEAGALGGDPIARACLGEIEIGRLNCRVASRHYMIAASCGYELALDNVLNGYKGGYVSKDEYADTLRAYKTASDEMKSELRTKADNEETSDTYNPEFFQGLDLLNQMRKFYK